MTKAVFVSLIGFTTLAATVQTAPLADYDGHPFVTNPAPKLQFERKLTPTLSGIDYDFPEQTAHGVALLSRFPEFKLSDRRIHVDGPWYDNEADNLHFRRGIASIGAIPRYREKPDAPTNLRKLPQFQKWSLMTDPVWYAAATRLFKKLEKEDPADPRIRALRLLGEGHCYTNDAAAYRALGRYAFQSESSATDLQGHFVGYPAIDIETTGGWEHQRNCNGWLYQGMAEAAREKGLKIVPMLYGQWQFSVGCFYESMREGGKGDPEYLQPKKDFLAAPDPTLVACQENNGILSMDGYQQAMWGDEPFYKRNTDGSLQLVNGLPVFNDATNTTAYGWKLQLEPREAKHCLDNLYRTALRMYLQHHRRAGAYPADSVLTKPFLSNCKIGAWSRYSNEGVQGIKQNDRPLPGWLLDELIGLYLFTADDITLWSSDMNFYPGPLGGNYTNAWRYNAHGVLESVVKAAHRYSALDPLHAAGGAFQWCWFNLPVVNKNETAGDRYFEKPIAIGKLRPFEGHTWLELFVAWPALDNTSKTLQVWLDKDGRRSRSYTIQLRHGRTYFYDAWQLPDEFKNLEGQHVWLRGADLLGVQRTWRGDWRKPADNSVTTPADFNSVTSGSLNIDWPVNRTVVQRSSSNSAVLRIIGKSPEKANRVEARLVPRAAGQGTATDWETLVPGPANGEFRGSITGQGGWYDLEVRARAGSSFVATSIVERVGIGEVFVVVGHSVAAGQKENIEGAVDDRVNTVPLNKENSAWQSYWPTGDAGYLPTPGFTHYGTGVTPAPFGSGNYFWSKFGEHVAQKQNVPVLIFNAAFGGTSLEHWGKSARNIQFEHSFVKTPIRMPYINLYNTLKKYVPWTGVRAVLADQGQNDWPEKNEELVFQNYLAWVKQARADLPHPELAIVVNRQTPFLRDAQIRRVQERMIRVPHCFPGPDYDTLPKEARPDAIHLGLSGQTQAAQLWAESLDARFFQSSKPWLPVVK